VSQFLAGKGISAMDNPPYSPAEFRLFPKLKRVCWKESFSRTLRSLHLGGKIFDRYYCSGF
jgi:hypothetical protein